MTIADQFLAAINGRDGLRTIIAEAADKIGVSLSNRDIDKLTDGLVAEWPAIIGEARGEAATTFARAKADRYLTQRDLMKFFKR